jgi:hypothetical protein
MQAACGAEANWDKLMKVLDAMAEKGVRGIRRLLFTKRRATCSVLRRSLRLQNIFTRFSKNTFRPESE